jgi:putative sugar O-methyltransferase
MKYGANKFWEYNNEVGPKKGLLGDLSGFKSNAVNYKIASFDPSKNGVRYLKTLLYNLCLNEGDVFWERLDAIHNRHIGSPIEISIKRKAICLDYFQAVKELLFIEDHFDFNGAKLLEIGAGYGRTCHSIMSNYDLASYTIVDLPNCMQLSKAYLAEVLDEDRYSRVKFIPVEDFERGVDLAVDLSLNIDSFAEMDQSVVREYLKYIDAAAKIFYVKNPVGKYLDSSLDRHSQGSEVVQMALKTGILRDVIDIDSSEEVEKQSSKFVAGYSPSERWVCRGESWALPWSYYWQALYKKK